MSSTPAPIAPALIARVIFGGMLVGPVMVAAVSFAVRIDSGMAGTIRYLALGFWGLTTLLAIALRRRVPERAAGTSVDDWWRANLSRALVIWALIESVGLVAAVGHFLTADALFLALFVLGFLVPMGRLTPGGLSSE